MRGQLNKDCENKMATFQIIGTTDGYIAKRDISFNGKTSVKFGPYFGNIEDAHKKLAEFMLGDYSNYSITHCTTEQEYFEEYVFGIVSEMAYQVDMKESEYLASHTKMLRVIYEKGRDKFSKFEGAGYYNFSENGYALLLDTDHYYEYDSRYYSVKEVETEEND